MNTLRIISLLSSFKMTHCQCKMTEAVFGTVEVWLNDNLSLQSAEWLYAIVRELHFNEAISSLPWQMCVVNGHKAFPNQWTELKGISHPTSKHYQSLLRMTISLFNIRHNYKVVLLWQYLRIKAQRDVYIPQALLVFSQANSWSHEAWDLFQGVLKDFLCTLGTLG